MVKQILKRQSCNYSRYPTGTLFSTPLRGKTLIRWSLLPILLFLCSNINAGEGTASSFSDPIDGLERRLELDSHEQLVTIKNNSGSILADFTTDGCSGGLSVGWEYLAQKTERLRAVHGSLPPWESCCVEHDKIYHTAGSRNSSADESFTRRKKADLTLRTCVLETGLQRIPELNTAYKLSESDIQLLYTTIANLMYRAVRLGGVPCSGLPWRWGYGWPECK